jgi:hypothetical protein
MFLGTKNRRSGSASPERQAVERARRPSCGTSTAVANLRSQMNNAHQQLQQRVDSLVPQPNPGRGGTRPTGPVVTLTGALGAGMPMDQVVNEATDAEFLHALAEEAPKLSAEQGSHRRGRPEPPAGYHRPAGRAGRRAASAHLDAAEGAVHPRRPIASRGPCRRPRRRPARRRPPGLPPRRRRPTGTPARRHRPRTRQHRHRGRPASRRTGQPA